MARRSNCSSDSLKVLQTLSRGSLHDSDPSISHEPWPITPMLDTPQPSSLPSASTNSSPPKFGRCIITNEITSHRWYPKRPKSDEKFTLLRNSFGAGNYGSSTNPHHFMFVREDWDRLYDRGWWLLVPSQKLMITMAQWSADAEQYPPKNGPPNILKIYGSEETFEYRLVPTQPMVDAGLIFPGSDEVNSAQRPALGVDDALYDPYSPKLLHLPIYPHLVVASNGILYHQLDFELYDSSLPGIALAVTTSSFWMRPGCGNTSLSAGMAILSKRRRSSSTPSNHLSKRPTILWSESAEAWRQDPDLEDSMSSESGVAADGVVAPLGGQQYPDPATPIKKWILTLPSPPGSCPSSPSVGDYREEPTSSPPEHQWEKWHQTWRDVIVRPNP